MSQRGPRQSVEMAAARTLILDEIQPLGAENQALRGAVGRVLAEELRASRSIPPLDNSAMDGFAVRAEDIATVPVTLRVVEDLPAGRWTDRKIGPGEAARIMTGAAIPDGADTVVMIEDTEPTTTQVRVNRSLPFGANIRRAGSDVSPGALVATAGTLINPSLVGMIAALGRTSVSVISRPRVAVLATGDELVEPDQLEDDGRIVTSNSYTLCATLERMGIEPIYLGIAKDEPEIIRDAFLRGLRADVVVSTGGVSVGDRDWIKQVLADLGGELRLWRVKMKPGAPLAFVTIDGRPVFGLPGNPVSSLVTFEQFVRPALLKMMGHRALYRPVEPVVLDDVYDKPTGRMHFVRVMLDRQPDGLHARLTGDQSSGVLLSMVQADGLAIVSAETTHLPAGTTVPVQILSREDLCDDPGFN